ncbi:MAG: YfhO family protein [Anaerolineae bacterium]|nr:YfhO family protein [Anaerolineae bacterium]
MPDENRVKKNRVADHWPDLLAVGALILLVITFFWRMAFTDRILPRGDMFTYFYPYWAYRNVIMRTGQLPLWNPYLFMGAPFLANSQAGVLYPPNWLLIALDAPTAVKVAIITHVAWAALGMYTFARRSLSFDVLPALLSALVFALGGYFTAQVEHVNQVQGLAWLPWLFWLWEESLHRRPWAVILLGVAFSMQLLAGHSQTAFISGFGLGLWAVWFIVKMLINSRRGESEPPQGSLLQHAFPLLIILIAVLIAVGLSAAQFLPTLELSRLSNRGGGLPVIEALAFSFNPAVVGRAFLPNYSAGPLFSEYIAYVGLIPLLLALVGASGSHGSRQKAGSVMLVVVGLFLALGAFNPVYWLLVRSVPGFDLFRAPARWLVLLTFGLAALVGFGLENLVDLRRDKPRSRRLVFLSIGLVVALAGLSFLAPLADDVLGASRPALFEVAIWLISAALFWFLVFVPVDDRKRVTLLSALAAVELFAASRSLSYNDLSAPTVWTDQRPAVSTLMAAQEGQSPPPRFLSLSDTAFDPGDKRELEAIYGPYLSDDALFDLLVAVKQQEILAPNLPMSWQVPSMDGFDGGILPTRDYTRWTSLFLTGESTAVDGRLREYLDAVPGQSWLRMANVGWVITDKTADLWIGGIYYDRQFPAALSSGDAVLGYPQHTFEATEISLVVEADDLSDDPVGELSLSLADGGEDLSLPISFAGASPVEGEDQLALLTVDFDAPLDLDHIQLSVDHGDVTVKAATLIDHRGGAFMPLTLSQDGSLRYIYSAEVKMYELSDTLPRATFLCDAVTVANLDAALDHLSLSPEEPVVVSDRDLAGDSACSPDDPGEATITEYASERIVVQVEPVDYDRVLILSDSWYPGWQAAVDGQPVEVLRANAIFRAVIVPAGGREVIFTYRCQPLITGTLISGLCWLGTIAGLAFFRLRRSV